MSDDIQWRREKAAERGKWVVCEKPLAMNVKEGKEMAEAVEKAHVPNMIWFNYRRVPAIALAKHCYKTLIEYGLLARLACEAHVITPALEHIVEANTLLSGLGFESCGVAAAHAIHNGLTVLKQTQKYFHGEKVAYGTLVSLFLTDIPMDVIEKVFSFCETVGLPTTLGDIGLSDISAADLMKVAESSCAEGESIYNEPTPVTAEMVFFSLKAADVFGRSRKKASCTRKNWRPYKECHSWNCNSCFLFKPEYQIKRCARNHICTG